jgi:mannose-6-phosphate isomerase-like protein (cupin superfamily)
MTDIVKNVTTTSIDELEATMLDSFPLVNCPVRHHFTDGVYVREVFLPKGTLATSKIHKTEHQFFILKGECIVWIDGVEKILKAPYIGITKAGTQRVVYASKNLVWATSHANPNNKTAEQIEDEIIEKHDNPHISEGMKKKIKNLLK